MNIQKIVAKTRFFTLYLAFALFCISDPPFSPRAFIKTIYRGIT
ncbi:hypothetical protein HMPREF3203_00851 [Proteus mirabilis]|nr:hypothetical protein HMPREF3203_00851 [Proteus mirabilis]